MNNLLIWLSLAGTCLLLALLVGAGCSLYRRVSPRACSLGSTVAEGVWIAGLLCLLLGLVSLAEGME